MNILFPTDLSDASAKVFEYAWQLARRLKLPVTMLHVFPVPVAPTAFGDPVAENISEELIQATEKSNADRLSEFREEILMRYKADKGETSVAVDTKLVMGFVGEEVVRLAEEMHSSYIVMGSRQSANLKRIFFGSSVQAVIKRAHVPIFVVPVDYTFKPVQKIGFATDLTLSDTEVINNVLELGDKLGAMVYCFHVHDSTLSVEDSILRDFNKTYSDRIKQGKMEIRLVDNVSILEGIEQFVAENKLDLLAVMKQKKYWLDFTASTTKQLVFQEKTPLLVFHE